ncbi:thioredoxin family protein [Paenibacillaceae bacterium WGS1546]|uniref:thioredoxin family protein n=1 Tax=Cohnella sp. WGS1546 TaxID=3366810 RepID=UPI00372D6C1F
MLEWRPADWKKAWTFTPAPFAVFVHTPLCGTCQAARKMLEVATKLVPELPVSSANLNVMPELAQRFRIESVPCLLFKRRDGSWSATYRFPSVVELVDRLRIERNKP